MTKASYVLVAVLGLPIFLAALVFGPTVFDLAFHRRPPERFLIPSGYNGWTRIDFRQKSAPPLPTEDGRRLLKLDAHGALQTSSDPQPGHGRDDFFYYSGDQRSRLSNAGVCQGGMVWQVETMVDDHSSTPFTRFFVGTEDQYRRIADPIGQSPVCQ